MGITNICGLAFAPVARNASRSPAGDQRGEADRPPLVRESPWPSVRNVHQHQVRIVAILGVIRPRDHHHDRFPVR